MIQILIQYIQDCPIGDRLTDERRSNPIIAPFLAFKLKNPLMIFFVIFRRLIEALYPGIPQHCFPVLMCTDSPPHSTATLILALG